jgi:predicted transcriptional regulator
MNTTSVSSPFSVRIDDNLRVRLQQAAEADDRSLSYITQKALSQYLDAREYKRREIVKVFKASRNENYILDSEMNDWLDSWGTTNELPPPKAAHKR